MKSLPIGTIRLFRKTVLAEDLAHFHAGAVHDVYATFALARDAEWSGRLLVLEMKEKDEEGIGTALSIEHRSPAFPGEEVVFESVLTAIDGNEIVSSFRAFVGNRVIATGTQKQRILPLEKIKRLLDSRRS